MVIKKNARHQFSIRTILAVTMFIAIISSWITLSHRYFRAAKLIEASNGFIEYHDWSMLPYNAKRVRWGKHCPGDVDVVIQNLAVFRRLNYVERLRPMTDAQLLQLGEIRQLTYLEFSNDYISADGIGAFADRTEIKHLTLYIAKLDPSILSVLPRFQRLESLDLMCNCSTMDLAAVKSICSIPRLRSVGLFSVRIQSEALSELSSHRGSLQIAVDRCD